MITPNKISQVIRCSDHGFPVLNGVAGGIHLWLVTLNGNAGIYRACVGMLSSDELARAERIVSGPARDQFVLTRAALRRILGGYLGTGGEPIPLATSPHGKPRLVKTGNADSLAFNVSHSGNRALLGFCRFGKVGVDIEQQVPLDDLRDVAGTAFSRSELAFLDSKRPNERLRFFYLIWSCKEALLKAEGLGLNRDPSSLCLFSENPSPTHLERTVSSGNFTIRWTLEVPGYAIAWATSLNAPSGPQWIGPHDLN